MSRTTSQISGHTGVREKTPCRHCGRLRSNQGRGLCWACNRKPEVRALYPRTHGGPWSGRQHSREYCPKAPCLHCKAREGNRLRGLCYRCAYQPGVRDLYPRRPQHYDPTQHGVGLNIHAGKELTAEPTAALPGSPEKVLVLIERARLGLCLFHPLDARIGD